MSDENVGGLPELPEPAMHERNPYLGLAVDPYEGLRALKWYSAEQMHAYARAALSAHGQPVVDAELMKRVLGAPYDGVTVGDFFVYADFSEHDTLGVVRAIVAAALGDTP